jgi:hypothetical protein
MKIKDIIVEQPSGYQAGKSLVSKIVSPSQWGVSGNQGYQSGKSFVSKLFRPSQWIQGNQGFQTGQSAVSKALSPSQWGQGSGQFQQGAGKTSVAKSIDHINLGNKKPFEVRRNLDNISSGQYYNQDIATAKMFHDQLKAGTFKPAIDVESTIGSLKKVIDGSSLSKDDLERVKKLKTATKNLS